jgi:formylmethanofuran dehydrogenase subunit B
VACSVCGCVCDDLSVTIRDEQVVRMAPGCKLAEPWYAAQSSCRGMPVAFVHGQPASCVEAVEAAAAILGRSRAPLIYGLSRSSTPGQQAAVRLADALGATIDTTASTCHAPSIMAVQQVGESTATLGEVKNRADLVVYWGSDPLTSHPRHVARFVEAAGEYVPLGRLGRHLVVIDVVRTATAAQADSFVQIAPGGDFELIWALRALVRRLDIPARDYGRVPWAVITSLAERFRTCSYGVAFFGLGLTRHGAAHANVEALLRLVTDLNAHTRFVARRMRIPGDVAGADTVLCWQTGYPFSVNLARGYPRYQPGEYTANQLLVRGEVDAVVLVGSEGVGQLLPAAQAALCALPTIVLDYPTTTCPWQATVRFTTAVYGLHRSGTAYRMDEVPIPLEEILPTHLPADHEILQLLLRAVRDAQCTGL